MNHHRNNQRGSKTQIPEDLESTLTPQQQKSLRVYQRAGWQLWFVRRALFQEKLVVIKGPHSGDLNTPRFGILNASGQLEQRPDVTIR